MVIYNNYAVHFQCLRAATNIAVKTVMLIWYINLKKYNLLVINLIQNRDHFKM